MVRGYNLCVHTSRHIVGGGDDLPRNAAVFKTVADVIMHSFHRGSGEDRGHPDGTARAARMFGYTFEDRRVIARLGYTGFPRDLAPRCRDWWV